MKTTHGRQASMRGTLKAVAATTTLCASAAAWANGGTISFVGAVLAPTFDIAMGHGPSAASAAMEGRQDYDAASGVTTVAYSSGPNAAPLAAVSIVATNFPNSEGASAPLRHIRVGFTDGSGRRISPDSAGRYLIGASGGVLTLAQKLSKAEHNSYAILVMDYR
ncbi:MAG: hypothetical protein JOZ29_17190 [Deltaproteobacteria bacterium]|nr:hypothetical protein [Deltaproteobacteria bacterium]